MTTHSSCRKWVTWWRLIRLTLRVLSPFEPAGSPHPRRWPRTSGGCLQTYVALRTAPRSLACRREWNNPHVDPQASSSPPAADVLRARYARRLPSSLKDLAGPVHGRIELPLHVVWSGLRAYDLDRPRQRMSLYRTVLTEGQRDDLIAFLSPCPRAGHPTRTPRRPQQEPLVPPAARSMPSRRPRSPCPGRHHHHPRRPRRLGRLNWQAATKRHRARLSIGPSTFSRTPKPRSPTSSSTPTAVTRSPSTTSSIRACGTSV